MKKIAMVNKIIFLLIFILLLFIPKVFAKIPTLNCSEYSSEFSQCAKENESGNGGARGITNTICLDENGERIKILTQIILDKKFSEIDSEIETYIDNLEDSKEYSLEKLDEVVNKFYIYGEYWNKYEYLCKEGILKEVFTCLDKVPQTEIKDFLGGENNGACIELVRIKLKAYRDVLFSVLKLNKLAVRKSARTSYKKDERTRYDTLIKMMGTINGYLNRMLKAWPTKTKSPYNCN